MATRRQFLQVGLASGAVLAGAGWLALRRGSTPAAGMRALDANALAIVSALVPAILDGVLPEEPGAHREARRETVEAFDRAISGLAPAVREEIGELFALLSFAPARILVAGIVSSWEEANVAEVSAFLARWRSSRFDLPRSGYQALSQLVNAAWYGNPAAWARIGYPGPPDRVPLAP